MSKFIAAAIEQRWYGRPGWLHLLRPLEWLFSKAAKRRKIKHQTQHRQFPVPIVVVGNISVGGTGKTPIIIALAEYLQTQGLRPGVVSRGYGRTTREPLLIDKDSDVAQTGDEPLLVFQASRCPVAVADDRNEAIALLLGGPSCDVVLADDGLQHYRMARDLEIVVLDGRRMLGNGHLLPVGPLREPPARLREVDWVLIAHSAAHPEPTALDVERVFDTYVQVESLVRVVDGEKQPLETLQNKRKLVAVVGIGNPEKFFATLDSLGLVYEKRVFPDHHRYTAADLMQGDGETLIMTEKDAIKCRTLVGHEAFALKIRMHLPEQFLREFFQSINELQQAK